MASRTVSFAGLSPALVFAFVAILVIVLLQASFVGMFEQWQQSIHQYGLIVLPAAFWLIWREAPAAPADGYRAVPWLLIALAALLALWLVARLAGIQIIEYGAALAAIPLTYMALVGWRVAWHLRFALALVLLALPFSDILVPPMMRWTADISEWLLAAFGIPFWREGQNISLPGGEFVVAEVCSGVRYFAAGMLTLLLYGYLSYRGAGKRLALLVVGAVLLIAANGLRAFIVMAVASATQMRWLSGADHIYFGWVLFGIVIVSLMWIGGRFADPLPDAAPAAGGTPATDGLAGGWPLILVLLGAMLIATLNTLQSGSLSFVKILLAAVLVVVVIVSMRRSTPAADGEGRAPGVTFPRLTLLAAVLLLGGSAWAAGQVINNEVRTLSMPAQSWPAGCRESGDWRAGFTPRVTQPAELKALTLRCGDADISVFVAAYDSAFGASELASGRNRFWPRRLQRKRSVRATPAGDVLEAVLSDQGRSLVAWQWYDVDGERAASLWQAKRLQLAALLSGRPAGGHLVVLVTDAGATGSDERLATLARALSP